MIRLMTRASIIALALSLSLTSSSHIGATEVNREWHDPAPSENGPSEAYKLLKSAMKSLGQAGREFKAKIQEANRQKKLNEAAAESVDETQASNLESSAFGVAGSVGDGPRGAASPAGSNNEAIYNAAVQAVGESSAAGPGGGNYACAWMVNRILDRSINQTINGDSTSSMEEVFQSKVRTGHAEEVSADQIQPGDIVLSPTVWSPSRRTGHVGIVGQGNEIYSNSSGSAAWAQNFTTERWNSYYGGTKRLEVKFYRLLS